MRGKFLFLDSLFHLRALILSLIILYIRRLFHFEKSNENLFLPSINLNLTNKNYSSDAKTCSPFFLSIDICWNCSDIT